MDFENPLTTRLNNFGGSNCCTYCGKSTSPLSYEQSKRCKACKRVVYCHDSCAKLDWNRHKYDCGWLRELRIGHKVVLTKNFLSVSGGKSIIDKLYKRQLGPNGMEMGEGGE